MNPHPKYHEPPIHSRFKKGQSGNPGGQPKEKPFTDAYRKFAKLSIAEIKALDVEKLTAAEAVAVGMLREAMKGKPAAACEAADRSDGKVKETLEVLDISSLIREAAERVRSRSGSE